MNGTSFNCSGTIVGPHPSVLSSTSGNWKAPINFQSTPSSAARSDDGRNTHSDDYKEE
jgi:hypothetical protein